MAEPTNKPPAKPAAAPAAKPPAGSEPTPADAAAIAAAAGTNIDPENQTPQQAQESAAAAMRQEADERGVKISDEDIARISGGVIAQLEARGAFEPPPAPPAASAPVAPGDTPAPPEPAQQPEPPRKRTFAERFVGRG